MTVRSLVFGLFIEASRVIPDNHYSVVFVVLAIVSVGSDDIVLIKVIAEM